MKTACPDKPLVSVVVPMFNHAQFVSDCLESVARQDYPRIELLALDDGSSDATFERATRWAESGARSLERCELWRQGNAGICRTLNELVRRSSGEFILPLASDDMLHPHAVRDLVSFYVRSCRPDDLLFSNVSLIDLDGNPVAHDALRERGMDSRDLSQSSGLLRLALVLRWGDPFQHQFYSRRFYDLVGGYDESLAMEDVYFAMRATSLGKARFAPVWSKKYRVRPGRSMTPGLRARDYSSDSRILGARELPERWKLLVRLVNYRNAQRRGVYRQLLTALTSAAFFVGCRLRI